MTTATKAPAVVAASSLGSIRVERLTCSIGAELSNINLADAAADEVLFAEVRSLLLQHKVLFFRDQDFSRSEHVALDRKSTRLNSSHVSQSRMPSSA